MKPSDHSAAPMSDAHQREIAERLAKIKTPSKALSIQQPWAWLIVNGYKDIENRDWPTKVRGRIAVHAGKKYDYSGAVWIRRMFPSIPIPDEKSAQLGGIVGEVDITDCVRHSDSRWFQGSYGFVLANAAPSAFRPLRGQLGFFASEPANG